MKAEFDKVKYLEHLISCRDYWKVKVAEWDAKGSSDQAFNRHTFESAGEARENLKRYEKEVVFWSGE